jgi:SAM-dependent methyltransferase
MTLEAATEPIALPRLKANNLYLLEWMRRQNRPGFRAMDYGCGDGGLVFTARSEGIDAYGSETYYDGARPEDLKLVQQFDPQTQYVREIKNNHLPFDDQWFDLIVANQVFEHIHDLEGTASEIARVLRPGGVVVSIFPIRGVIREPHLAIPFIHHFPKNRLRRAYFKIVRKLSKRARRVDWGVGEAAVDKAFWFMDTHTCYRNVKQVKKIFTPGFNTQFIEPNWLAYRLPKLSKLKRIPGAKLASTVFSRFAAGTVLLATKRF